MLVLTGGFSDPLGLKLKNSIFLNSLQAEELLPSILDSQTLDYPEVLLVIDPPRQGLHETALLSILKCGKAGVVSDRAKQYFAAATPPKNTLPCFPCI